ncbi:MAG: hypothetical protein WDO73_34020 [Ignavibacteriota bacterium]
MQTAANIAADKQGGQRVLLVAVGDLLERSPDGADRTSITQSFGEEGYFGRAGAYRQTALQTGDTAMAGVLEDLERVLMDIANEPSQMAPAQFENLQRRMQSAGILFKIRVLGSSVKQKQEAGEPVGRPDRQKL